MISPWPPGTGPGTVSHGTLREEDLVPVFLSVLESLDPVRKTEISLAHSQTIDILADSEQAEVTPVSPDAAGWLMEALFDALNDAAPEGFFFGAIEGDGSDFGFWEIDPEEG